jgi:hypothetical protein
MNPPQQPPPVQVSATMLWSHELKDGKIEPPPPPNGMPGKWVPMNLVPAGGHMVIQWGWVQEPGRVAVVSPTGGFVGPG